MWVMLLSLIVGSAAMFFVFIERVAVTVVLFIVARRQKMSVSNWVASGLLFGLWSFLPYAYARIKIARNKCHGCDSSVLQNTDYCANCGEKTEKINEGKIVVKFIFVYFGVCLAIYVFGTLIPAIIN